jgi:hypothetical protein
MSRFMKETNLLSIAATPFAERKMNPEANALKRAQFVIKSLGLETASLFTTGRQCSHLPGQGAHHFSEPLHLFLCRQDELLPINVHVGSKATTQGLSLEAPKPYTEVLSGLQPVHDALLRFGRQAEGSWYVLVLIEPRGGEAKEPQLLPIACAPCTNQMV